MINVIIGKACKCEFCEWSGPYSLVISMAGFEFCPSCLHRYTGFMPELRPTPRAVDGGQAGDQNGQVTLPTATDANRWAD